MVYNTTLSDKDIQDIYLLQKDFEESTNINRQPPAGVDVEAKDIPIRVLKNNGTFEELILNIRAW